MIELFVMLIRENLSTLEDVPEEIHDSVKAIIEKQNEDGIEYPSYPTDDNYISLNARILDVEEIVEAMLMADLGL